MTVFMLVPMLAPLIGQQAEFVGGWQAIFALYLALAILLLSCVDALLSTTDTVPDCISAHLESSRSAQFTAR